MFWIAVFMLILFVADLLIEKNENGARIGAQDSIISELQNTDNDNFKYLNRITIFYNQ